MIVSNHSQTSLAITASKPTSDVLLSSSSSKFQTQISSSNERNCPVQKLGYNEDIVEVMASWSLASTSKSVKDTNEILDNSYSSTVKLLQEKSTLLRESSMNQCSQFTTELRKTDVVDASFKGINT